jgi:hypothetical protein
VDVPVWIRTSMHCKPIFGLSSGGAVSKWKHRYGESTISGFLIGEQLRL